MLREEYRQRLVQEYRYAATKMQESPQPAKKHYYFSVLFGESQRILNWEWDRDLSLVYMTAHYTYNQMSLLMQPGVLNGSGRLRGKGEYDVVLPRRELPPLVRVGSEQAL